MTIQYSKTDAPMGYSPVGLFKTKQEAMDWYNAAIKAHMKYPFWLNPSKTVIGKRWILWLKKPKNEKMCGKGSK